MHEGEKHYNTYLFLAFKGILNRFVKNKKNNQN